MPCNRFCPLCDSEFGVSESEAYSLLSLDQNSYTDKVVEIGRQKVK